MTAGNAHLQRLDTKGLVSSLRCLDRVFMAFGLFDDFEVRIICNRNAEMMNMNI